MSSIIQIHRSGVTSIPTTLSPGELAYSWEPTTAGKLYIGWGDETIPGEADNIAVIGGKFYVDKLDHAPGILTSNSAILVDNDLKIDILNIDNITINGNTISSTNIDGNIVISPNGLGSIDADNSRIINVSTPTANTDSANKEYVDTAIQTVSVLNFIGDAGNGSIVLSNEIFDISGGVGISTAAANNTITINLDDSGVIANTYGSTTEIPVITVNSQGQITSANIVNISTDLSIAGDVGTDTVSLGIDTLTISGGVSISTLTTNNNITINLNNTGVIANTYGSTTEIPVISINAQGQITSANVVNISTDLSIAGDTGTDLVSLGIDTLTFAGTTGIVSAVTNNNVEFRLANTTVTAGAYGSPGSVATFTVDAQGRLTAAANSDIQITTSQIASFQENVEDVVGNLLHGDTNSGITVTYTDSANTLIISAEDATFATKGVASFSNTNFTVLAGFVTANDIVVGNTVFTLGETVTDLEGLTSINAGNITIVNNNIESTNVDGDIIISPNGSGSVNVSSSKITNVSSPILSTDAATKGYVDTIAAASLHYHDPVRVESHPVLDAIYDNGTDGVGATLTNNGTQAALIIDSVTLIAGDRVLVYRQTNKAHNGVYVVSDVGSVSTNWVLTRSSDTDTYSNYSPIGLGTGDAFFVNDGNDGAGELYVMTTPGTITYGTTEILFSKISDTQIYSAGAGLSLVGTEFSVNIDGSSIEIAANALRVKALGITNNMLAGSISNAKLLNSFITIVADAGVPDPVYLGETLTVTGGTGISTVVGINQITITGDNASYSLKGVASFNITDFTVVGGAVSIKDEKIQDVVANYIVGGTATTITYDDTANTLTFNSDVANTTAIGVASFSSTNFAVDINGEVTITAIDGGAY